LTAARHPSVGPNVGTPAPSAVPPPGAALQARLGLARAVDAKDPSTRRHSDRVADLAVAIAAELGWAEPECGLLHEAAVVHDVGKIAIPDQILFKPDRLTEHEYATVKDHSRIGAEMLDGVLRPEQVAWVRHHHERWSGGGYPDGLSGVRIPEGARIIAVADAWDAITSMRPYGRPRTVDEAIVECRLHSGTQFWPVAVDALDHVIFGVR